MEVRHVSGTVHYSSGPVHRQLVRAPLIDREGGQSYETLEDAKDAAEDNANSLDDQVTY